MFLCLTIPLDRVTSAIKTTLLSTAGLSTIAGVGDRKYDERMSNLLITEGAITN